MDWKRFILAGNATFTLENTATHNRFTFRVRQALDRRTEQPLRIHDKLVWWVGVLSGPDNTRDYQYMGALDEDWTVSLTTRSRFSHDADSFKAFRWLCGIAARDGELPKEVRFYHAGRCGRCGRQLTVPESIETGFGPECAGFAYGDHAGHDSPETRKKIKQLLHTARRLSLYDDPPPCDGDPSK